MNKTFAFMGGMAVGGVSSRRGEGGGEGTFAREMDEAH